jgi:hypothetical protein
MVWVHTYTYCLGIQYRLLIIFDCPTLCLLFVNSRPKITELIKENWWGRPRRRRLFVGWVADRVKRISVYWCRNTQWRRRKNKATSLMKGQQGCMCVFKGKRNFIYDHLLLSRHGGLVVGSELYCTHRWQLPNGRRLEEDPKVLIAHTLWLLIALHCPTPPGHSLSLISDTRRSPR